MSGNNGLVWLDIETPCIDEKSHAAKILELAMVHTDADLNVLGSIELVTKIDPIEVESWDQRCVEMHTGSGLIDACIVSTMDQAAVELSAINWLRVRGFDADVEGAVKPPMCGNSIGTFDRVWIREHMPNLSRQFHHRNIDVSMLYELGKLWYPDEDLTPGIKSGNHRAIADLTAAIERLRAYRENMFK